MALYTVTLWSRHLGSLREMKMSGTEVSIENTAGMATGDSLRMEDVAPVQVAGGET